jgi:hypothetical protein
MIIAVVVVVADRKEGGKEGKKEKNKMHEVPTTERRPQRRANDHVRSIDILVVC